jgi:hypothetical protein
MCPVSVFSAGERKSGYPHHGSFPLKVLRFLAVFLMVAVTVTVAAVTALFIFWSYVPAQPGTATALAMLFLVAPGLGIASGIFMGVRSVSDWGSPRLPRALLVLAAAVVGGLAGFGASMAAIDLTYADRWNNPASAPSWLPFAPPVAGIATAVLLALLMLVSSRRWQASLPAD